MKKIICRMLSEGPPKKREASALCGWQHFFVPIIIGMIFFVSFFDQAKKERINDETLVSYELVWYIQLFSPDNSDYLKELDIEVGLLLNFGKKPQFRRKLFTNDLKKNLSV